MHWPTLALVSTLAVAPAAAGEFSLQWPLDCSLGETCHIQQYVDHDPGRGAQDYKCNPLSYDGHKGTDIAFPYLSDIEAGEPVRAAAAGTVLGLRNTMPDTYATASNAESLKGRECGNGVVIKHADGWQTQYCHMKRGSIRVQKGQQVKAGTLLGEVGLSGKTQFPHLHLSVRHNGKVVDPFAVDTPDSCGAETNTSLWADPPEYQPGGLLGGGFNTGVPEFADIKAGRAALPRLSAKSPGLVFWAYAYGGRRGDRLRLTITGPRSVFSVHEITLERDQAQFFRASGKRLREESWSIGQYRGQAVLLRDDQEIDQIEMEIRVE